MVGNRHRSSSVVSNIALNVPVLQVDEHGKIPDKIRPLSRSKSFSMLESDPLNHIDKGNVLDPLNLEERHSIWSSINQSYRAFLDISFEDYKLLNDDETENEFLSQLQFIKGENSKFVTDLDGIVSHLDDFLKANVEVTNETSEFKMKSNNLIKDLDELQHVHDGLTERLRVFESLDGIVTKLSKSNSTKSIIRSGFRHDILIKLDEAIIFVNDERHKSYKEIDVFKFRFDQCLIRALSLIRNYIVKTIRNIESDTIESINELKDKKSTVLINSIVNNKFSESMSILYPPFIELYKRSFNNDDVSNLLEDVYNQYQKSRSNLVKTYITGPHSNEIKPEESIANLMQSSLLFFSTIIERELEIFEKVFFLPPNELNQVINNSLNMVQMHKYFEVLLEPLYYSLRNKIIRETQVDVLCELINIIQSYFNRKSELDDDESHMQYINVNYELLLQPILEDVQTRLVFRVQIYLESNIVHYRKTGRELIIESRKENTDKIQTNGDDGELAIANMEFVSSSKMVYPPMVNAIKLLTKIYTLVKQPVFDVLTGSVVHLSLLSLKSNFGYTTNDLNIKLYEMESLLWFKDSINMFDIEHVRKNVNLDFSGLKNLVSRFTSYGQNAQLKSTEHETLFNTIWGSIPSVVNDFSDCRIELQIELRNVVHEFIEISSNGIISQLTEITSKIQNDEKIDNSAVSKGINTLKTSIEEELPRLKVRVGEFISDDRIFEFLLDGIQNVIIKEYGMFYEAITHLSESQSDKYGALIAEVMEVDEVSKLWADSVKKLFILSSKDDNGEIEADLALSDDEDD